jgi:hypothetical protein
MKTNLLLKLIFGATLIGSLVAYGQPARAPAGKLHDKMRKLWHDHVALTRDWILQDVANLLPPCQEEGNPYQ